MAPLMLLLFLLSEAASDVIEITVHPGQDVNLPCQAPDSFIRALEWTRPDLEPDTVLLYSDGHFETDDQNPSFKDRVELVDRELKNGDVSLILKNVSSIDNGTYKCGVKAGGPRRKKRDSDPIRTIRTVRLQVTEPGLDSENSMNDVPEDGNSSPVDLYVGLAAGVLILVVVAVVGVLIYKRHKKKRSGVSADDVEAGHRLALLTTEEN
ncbi:CD276 antigen homolog [Sander lucioperca]|uniref:CD276 antigen homolog n=1 Tax=Sander lucioperca TaxID=283035 RepID=UPI00125D9D6B|nr:CD276 antigen homolog [Sander lucioperca]XP_035849560.1 CD276 antigen homolog [Sander lucioperca]